MAEQHELRLPTMLATAIGTRRVLVAGGTVREALRDAFRQAPLLEPLLLTERGEVRQHVHLFLNEDDVRGDLDAALAPGDELVVLQAMSGG